MVFYAALEAFSKHFFLHLQETRKTQVLCLRFSWKWKTSQVAYVTIVQREWERDTASGRFGNASSVTGYLKHDYKHPMHLTLAGGCLWRKLMSVCEHKRAPVEHIILLFSRGTDRNARCVISIFLWLVVKFIWQFFWMKIVFMLQWEKES